MSENPIDLAACEAAERELELTGVAAGVRDAAKRDASVLGGLTRIKTEPATGTQKPAPEKPARRRSPKPTDVNGKVLPARKAENAPASEAPAKTARTRKPASAPAPAASAPAPKRRTRKAPAASAPAPEPEPATNGASASANGSGPAASPARLETRRWARKLAEAVAAAFADESDEAKEKAAYWIHGLPYGGADGGNAGGSGRWFPESLPRPTTHDWR